MPDNKDRSTVNLARLNREYRRDSAAHRHIWIGVYGHTSPLLPDMPRRLFSIRVSGKQRHFQGGGGGGSGGRCFYRSFFSSPLLQGSTISCLLPGRA